MGISTKLVDDTIVCESKDPETWKTMTTLTITRHLFDKRPFSPGLIPKRVMLQPPQTVVV